MVENSINKHAESLLAVYYDKLPSNLFFMPVFLVLIAVYFAQSAPLFNVLIWLLLCLFTLPTAALLPKAIYKDQELETSFEPWVNMLACLNFMAGLAVSSMVWFCLPFLSNEQSLLIIVCFTLAPAISLSFIYSIPRVWLANNVALIFPFALSVAQTWTLSSEFTIAYLIWLVFYFCYLFVLAKRLYEDKIEALNLQDKIEHANDAKARFLATASHDLRQPLHALGFLVDALKRSPDKDLSLLEKIDITVSSLEESFDSLLDISKLQAGKIDAERSHFDLGDLLLELQSQSSGAAQNKDLFLRLESKSQAVYSDRSLIKRILSNLIINAIQYTKNGGVSAEVCVANSEVSISIIDTGIGILENEKHDVFNEFYRLHESNGYQRGFGLGLAIVKKLCDFLDCQLVLESSENVGTRFTITLPKGQADLYQTEPQVDNTIIGGLAGRSVILVDDNLDIRDAVQESLNYWGCRTYCFTCGEEAMKALKDNDTPIDIIIADLHLANGECGLGVAESLQSLNNQEAVIVIISGDTSLEARDRVNAAGLPLSSKPIKPAQLRLMLIDQLSKT